MVADTSWLLGYLIQRHQYTRAIFCNCLHFSIDTVMATDIEWIQN